MLQGTMKIEAPTVGAIPKKNKAKKIDWGNAATALKNVTISAKSSAVLVTITPEIAAAWLDNLNSSNRPINKSHVATLARDITAGNWLSGPGCEDSAIQIGSNGVILNGQHRLSAVVQSGRTVQMWVVFGADPSGVAAIDRGRTRSHADVFTLSSGESIDKRFFAIARSMMFGTEARSDSPSYQEVESFVMTHRKALDFAAGVTFGAGGNLRRGAVGGAIARAYYHVDHGVLTTFASVLLSGVATNQSQRVVVMLRDWLLTNPSAGGKSRYLCYRKTARALMAFRDGEKLKKLYEVAEDPFPLPGKVAKAKRK